MIQLLVYMISWTGDVCKDQNSGIMINCVLGGSIASFPVPATETAHTSITLEHNCLAKQYLLFGTQNYSFICIWVFISLKGKEKTQLFENNAQMWLSSRVNIDRGTTGNDQKPEVSTKYCWTSKFVSLQWIKILKCDVGEIALKFRVLILFL